MTTATAHPDALAVRDRPTPTATAPLVGPDWDLPTLTPTAHPGGEVTTATARRATVRGRGITRTVSQGLLLRIPMTSH